MWKVESLKKKNVFLHESQNFFVYGISFILMTACTQTGMDSVSLWKTWQSKLDQLHLSFVGVQALMKEIKLKKNSYKYYFQITNYKFA